MFVEKSTFFKKNKLDNSFFEKNFVEINSTYDLILDLIYCCLNNFDELSATDFDLFDFTDITLLNYSSFISNENDNNVFIIFQGVINKHFFKLNTFYDLFFLNFSKSDYVVKFFEKKLRDTFLVKNKVSKIKRGFRNFKRSLSLRNDYTMADSKLKRIFIKSLKHRYLYRRSSSRWITLRFLLFFKKNVRNSLTKHKYKFRPKKKLISNFKLKRKFHKNKKNFRKKIFSKKKIIIFNRPKKVIKIKRPVLVNQFKKRMEKFFRNDRDLNNKKKLIFQKVSLKKLRFLKYF